MEKNTPDHLQQNKRPGDQSEAGASKHSPTALIKMEKVPRKNKTKLWTKEKTAVIILFKLNNVVLP